VWGWTCFTAIAAAALTVPVASAALKERLKRRKKSREAERKQGNEPKSPTQSVVQALKDRPREVGSSLLSFVLVLATIVLLVSEWGNAPTRDLACTYIAGAVFEIIGIWATAEALIFNFDGTGSTPEGWTNLRGPLLIVGGVILGLVGNLVWLQNVPTHP
jgi:hypothetical protein